MGEGGTVEPVSSGITSYDFKKVEEVSMRYCQTLTDPDSTRGTDVNPNSWFSDDVSFETNSLKENGGKRRRVDKDGNEHEDDSDEVAARVVEFAGRAAKRCNDELPLFEGDCVALMHNVIYEGLTKPSVTRSKRWRLDKSLLQKVHINSHCLRL